MRHPGVVPLVAVLLGMGCGGGNGNGSTSDSSDYDAAFARNVCHSVLLDVFYNGLGSTGDLAECFPDRYAVDENEPNSSRPDQVQDTYITLLRRQRIGINGMVDGAFYDTQTNTAFTSEEAFRFNVGEPVGIMVQLTINLRDNLWNSPPSNPRSQDPVELVIEFRYPDGTEEIVVANSSAADQQYAGTATILDQKDRFPYEINDVPSVGPVVSWFPSEPSVPAGTEVTFIVRQWSGNGGPKYGLWIFTFEPDPLDPR